MKRKEHEGTRPAADTLIRASCKCDSCITMERTLAKLDDAVTSGHTMHIEDVEDLCEAREILAAEIGATYDEDISRYVRLQT